VQIMSMHLNNITFSYEAVLYAAPTIRFPRQNIPSETTTPLTNILLLTSTLCTSQHDLDMYKLHRFNLMAVVGVMQGLLAAFDRSNRKV
jgi:hypothetical protein